MALFDRLRNLMARQRPRELADPAIDLAGTQAAALAGALGAPPPPIDVELLLDRIDQRLGAQTDCTREMVAAPIAGLSQAAQTLVEIKTHSAQLDEAVVRLGETAARQAEAIARVERQVGDGAEAARRSAETTQSITAELQEVLAALARTQEDLRRYARAHEDRTVRLDRTLAMLQRRFVYLSVACGAAAVVALALALI
jgi:hypothetical protein